MRSLFRSLGLVALAAFGLAQTSVAATLAPVNPNATAGAKQLYAYLQNLGGQGILSGQLSMLNEATNDTTTHERYQLSKNGGRMPAIYASNFGDWPMDYQDSIIRTIKHKWTKSEGKLVVMLCWHTVQPDAPEDSGYAAMSRFSSTSPYPTARIDSILKPGTALNVEHMKRLTVAGRYLKSLDSAGIPVIWRPYHENNGAFFWWGQQPRFKELWQQMYGYYTDSLKLDNLLWAYSMCWFGEGDRWIDSLYPGHRYVDILGADIYAGSYGQDYQSWIYGTLLSKAEGRPIGITENGTMPDVTVLKYTQPKWAFFCTWWGYEVDTLWKNAYYHPAGYSLQNSDALYKAVYGDPYTITRDEIDFGIGPDAHVFLSTGVSPTGSGRVTVSPDSNGRYSKGQSLVLSAVPAEGWVFTGWQGDTSGMANPLALTLNSDKSIRAGFAALKGTNLLLNGKFSDSLAGWGFSAWEPGAAATAVVEGADSALHVNVTGTGADPWGVQLTQGLLLDSGVTYSLSYDVRGDAKAILTCAVGESSGKYRKLFSQTDTLVGTAVRTVTGTFIDTLPSSSALRLEFSVGAQKGDLHLDNIKVARISGSDLPSGIGAWGARPSVGALTLDVRGGVLSWNVPTALAGAGILRVLDVRGRELSRSGVTAGTRSGSLELAGQGLRFVVLDAACGSMTAKGFVLR